MQTIFFKELKVFFNSLIAYLVISVFLFLAGLFFWLYPDTNIIDYGFADMGSFFSICPYVFLFLIPAICMKMFSEEYRLGTFELLFTKPLSTLDVVLGKYLACLSIVFLALLPTFIYVVSLYFLGNPVGNIDLSATFGSYLGLLFLASAFVSIGIFCSALTQNQIVAFIASAILCYFFYDGISQIGSLITGNIGYWIEYLGIAYHFEAISRGVLDTRDLIYYLSFTAIFLLLATLVINKKRA
jgi:ABC-2 type transport system permease protein